MRALRVVGFDGDADAGVVILEDPERRERFTVPADERLRAAARGDIQGLGKVSTDLESQLRPREIQARIRAGASVEEVAEAAGVPQQKIERFAYPVLLERSRFADLAQRAHPTRPDGPDVRTLAEVVARTFELRGHDYARAEWDAWRGEDNRWVVALRWTVGCSDIAARWTYHPGSHGGTVNALDEHAADLVDGQHSRPPRRVGSVLDLSKPEVEQPPVAVGRITSAGRASEPSTSTPPAAGPRTAKPTAASPRTGPNSAEPNPGVATSPAPAGDPSPESAPAEARPAGAGAKRPRKGKPVMPSWEDVLLGVKTQRS